MRISAEILKPLVEVAMACPVVNVRLLRVQTTEGGDIWSSTDLTHFLTTATPHEGATGVDKALPADQLKKFVKGKKTGVDIHIDALAGEWSVSAGPLSFALPMWNSEDLPVRPTFTPSAPVTVDLKAFRAVAKVATTHAEKPDGCHRPTEGMHVVSKDGMLHVEGTDGKRLFQSVGHPCDGPEIDIVLEAKTVHLLTSPALDPKIVGDYLTITRPVPVETEGKAFTPDTVELRWGSSVLVAKLLAAPFPKTSAVIPAESDDLGFHVEDVAGIHTFLASSPSPGKKELDSPVVIHRDGRVHVSVDGITYRNRLKIQPKGAWKKVGINQKFVRQFIRGPGFYQLSTVDKKYHANGPMVTRTSDGLFVLMPMSMGWK